MTHIALILGVICFSPVQAWKELAERPHLGIEWTMAAPLPGETPECAAARATFSRAMRGRDWRSALDSSAKAIAAMKGLKPEARDSLEFSRGEIYLLADAPAEAIRFATPGLEPLGVYRGSRIATVADYFKSWRSLAPNDSDPVAKGLQEKFSYWHQKRKRALELIVNAFRLKGDLASALRAQELIEVDIDAWSPIEPPRDPWYVDRASQIVPLRAAAKGRAALVQMAAGGYAADRKLDVDEAEQKRLVAVFALMALGGDAKRRGDWAGAKHHFLEAKRLMEVCKPIVNREMLQWLIAREELTRLSGTSILPQSPRSP
ncbi:MAG: hypothetical protein HZC36_15520 [Armatimonadetes bacterium]|nr:hypothetical protein [Armatimonadota bacterium]